VVGSISTLKQGRVGDSHDIRDGQGKIRVGKGGGAWRRYVEFLSERGLVVPLKGDNRNLLLGNMRTRR
jgi:hypothetical protein